jgi:hypothetical protein
MDALKYYYWNMGIVSSAVFENNFTREQCLVTCRVAFVKLVAIIS